MIRVVKFGGTSVADTEKIKSAANIVHDMLQNGDKVVVVVSAMSGETNKIISLCHEFFNDDSRERAIEVDSALSTGETLVASLFALALMAKGVSSRSYQAWQLPITTNNIHNCALVQSVDLELIKNNISNSVVPVIAGFQGVTPEQSITTLGRGGSDTTAAIIAAGLSADFCDIYTDVDGVYSADPRLVHNAKIIKKLSFDEMLEFAGAGAKVLHPRSVEICKRYNINLRILSSQTLKSGTEIMNSVNEINKIIGVSYIKKLNIAVVNAPGYYLKNIIEKLSKTGGNLYQISCSSEDKFSIIYAAEYSAKIETIFKEYKLDFKIETNVGAVKIIGAGMRHDLSILDKILFLLEDNKIEYKWISNSELMVSIFVNEEYIEKLVKLFYSKFIDA